VEFHLLDCELEKLRSRAEVVGAILHTHPNVVGFSVATGTVKAVGEIAQALKAAVPGLRIAAGGPHIAALPEEAIPGVDANIFGEGEITFLEYLQKLDLGGTHSEIAGCVQFRDRHIVSRGPQRDLISNVDDVPLPERGLLRRHAYFHSYPYPGVHDFTTLFTSRGCPYNCNFCGNEVIWGGRVRYHSLARTFAEIDQVVAEGYDLIFFDDDTFTVDKARVLRICEYISARHPRLQWICHLRADTVDREMLAAMKRAGCVEAQVGVEAGDPDVLRRTDKSMTIEQVRRTFAWLHEVRINSWATFILGNQGENPDTIRASLKLAKEIDPTYCSFIVLLPFPGTRIFEDYKNAGFITTFDWERYSWHGVPVISTDQLSTTDLIHWRKRAYLEFYLRPRKLLQTVRHVLRSGSSREIMRNFRAWKVLVGSRV
jgi:radical SAM superfamily enzyme YgiQ (UPF0313 family)